jgi:hypothetical protein
MGRIPISIEKIKVDSHRFLSTENKVNETVKYLFKLVEKGQQWERTFTCDRDDLLKLRAEIDKLIESTTTAEVLKITPAEAKIVDEHYKTDKLCQYCNFKLTYKCNECLFVLQSPLERQLYLELSKSHVKFEVQYPLNWYGKNISIEGKSYGDKHNNFKDVLTIVDFYIEKRQTRLCVYTDGHTYHERTEDQASRDRNIDRKLQELGYQVLRYTGKDVNERMGNIISDIQKWIE